MVADWWQIPRIYDLYGARGDIGEEHEPSDHRVACMEIFSPS